MNLTTSLTNPWTVLVGAIFGGLSWAVGAPVIVGGAVGVAVWGTGAGLSALLSRGEDETNLHESSPAQHWLRRAEEAVRDLDEVAGDAKGSLKVQATGVAESARSTSTTLKRLAAQVAAVEAAMTRVDPHQIQGELRRLDGEISRARASARGELESARVSLVEQEKVAERLHDVHAGLVARVQGAALGLEGLVVRLAEVVAVHENVGGDHSAGGQVTALGEELEGLRRGLVETETLSKSALQGVQEGPAGQTA